jgi:hypothetical protein
MLLFFPRLMNFKFFLGLKLVQIKLILYFLHPSGVSLNSLFPYGSNFFTFKDYFEYDNL